MRAIRQTVVVTVLTLMGLAAIGAPVCAGWQGSPAARMACCAAADHECDPGDADDCCAAGERQRHGELFVPWSLLGFAALSAFPGDSARAVTLTHAPHGAEQSTLLLRSPADARLLNSVFLI